MSFTGKVVLVTGGSSGIGASAAVAFAAAGGEVCIVGRNEAHLASVAERCAARGNTPLILQADLSRDDDVRRVIQTVVEHHGRLDVLVNNAGIAKSSKIDDENHIAVYDEIMSTNIRPVVLLTSLASKYLKASKGNIINVSSVAGKSTLRSMGITGYAAYCTSKAAMDQFSRICAMEMAQYGVRVNVISPGPVDTPILDGIDGEKGDLEYLKSHTALRMVTQPEEIADLILYLASDKAKSITGGDYLIDAGFLVNPSKN